MFYCIFTVASLPLLGIFEHLYFLDLSENDFFDIKDALERISKLPNLKCLSLEGNPCSVKYYNILGILCTYHQYVLKFGVRRLFRGATSSKWIFSTSYHKMTQICL